MQTSSSRRRFPVILYLHLRSLQRWQAQRLAQATDCALPRLRLACTRAEQDAPLDARKRLVQVVADGLGDESGELVRRQPLQGLGIGISTVRSH